jgi:hypothetical protein
MKLKGGINKYTLFRVPRLLSSKRCNENETEYGFTPT